MEEKKIGDQVQGLSGQLMELFVANLLAKNNVNLQEAKQRLTEEQRENLKNTVVQLKAQVDEFLENRTVRKTVEDIEKTTGQAVNPLHEAFIQRKKQKKREKND